MLAEQQEPAAGSGSELQITVYPHELQVREGKEARFECRARTAEGGSFPQTRWTKVGAPLPRHAQESGAELFIPSVGAQDRGRYACIAVLNGRSVEAYATLEVQSCEFLTFLSWLPCPHRLFVAIGTNNTVIKLYGVVLIPVFATGK